MLNQKAWKILSDWKHIKSLLSAESITVTNNFIMKQFFLQILQYNIRKSLKIQESFLIDKKVCKFNIVIIQKQEHNINDLQSFNSAHNFFHLMKNSSSQSKTCIYVNCNCCYDPSYATMLIAMLVTMLMTIADRSPLGYRVVPRPTLFRISLCSPESYR